MYIEWVFHSVARWIIQIANNPIDRFITHTNTYKIHHAIKPRQKWELLIFASNWTEKSSRLWLALEIHCHHFQCGRSIGFAVYRLPLDIEYNPKRFITNAHLVVHSIRFFTCWWRKKTMKWYFCAKYTKILDSATSCIAVKFPIRVIVCTVYSESRKWRLLSIDRIISINKTISESIHWDVKSLALKMMMIVAVCRTKLHRCELNIKVTLRII